MAHQPAPMAVAGFEALRIQRANASAAVHDPAGTAAFRTPPRILNQTLLPESLASFAMGMSVADRQRAIQQAQGCWHTLELEVERIEPSLASEVPPGWVGGCTVVGVPGQGLAAAVCYPRSHAAHIYGIKPGMRIRVQGGLIAWNEEKRLLRLAAV